MAAGSMGDSLLKVAVIILSSINAVMWQFYTESTLMAAVWVAIALAFSGWFGYDVRNR